MTGPARPSAATPRDYHFPRFERRTLANGLRLVIAPVRKLPVATVMTIIGAGAENDPVGRDGLARLTALVLAEGTRSLDGAALTEQFERLGTGLDTYADWDAATARLTALPQRLPDVLSLLGDVLMDPSLPDREIERLRAERLAELLQLKSEPRGLADDAFARTVYAPNARYALPEGGAQASVRAITRSDVETFHRRYYTPARTTVVIAGDVGVDDATTLVERTLGAWKGSVLPNDDGVSGGAAKHIVNGGPPQPLDSANVAARRTWLVPKTDAAQSELRVGHVGLPRAHPAFMQAMVMNAILGGLFSSRINLNLREEHGYTYGAFSEFDWRRSAGPFLVGSAVQSESTAAAAREVLNEIDRMRTELIKPDELTLATSYLDGVFPIRYETTAAIAGALSNLVIYGLPENYFDTYRDRVRAVTVEHVREVAERHLNPELLQVVAVGDAEQLREGLSVLGHGTMDTWKADADA